MLWCWFWKSFRSPHVVPVAPLSKLLPRLAQLLTFVARLHMRFLVKVQVALWWCYSLNNRVSPQHAACVLPGLQCIILSCAQDEGLIIYDSYNVTLYRTTKSPGVIERKDIHGGRALQRLGYQQEQRVSLRDSYLLYS
eukprot:g66009.t1